MALVITGERCRVTLSVLSVVRRGLQSDKYQLESNCFQPERGEDHEDC